MLPKQKLHVTLSFHKSLCEITTNNANFKGFACKLQTYVAASSILATFCFLTVI